MKRRIALLTPALMFASRVPGQQRRRREDPPDIRLPNGRRQSDEILKHEHSKNLEDAAELLKLTEELKLELEKNEPWVLSLGALKKTEEIEKLAKRIRGRLKRF